MKDLPWLLAALALLGSCVFRGGDPPRFYEPDSAALHGAVGDRPAAAAAARVAVRLRRVRSAAFFRERIVWRASEVEYGFYEERRWNDLPAHYVERALLTKLRETPGLRLTDDPRAAALYVDVVAFEEVLDPVHAADVRLAVSLRGGRRGDLLERTFSARVGIADGDPASLARAMGRALDDVVAQVAEGLAASVRAR